MKKVQIDRPKSVQIINSKIPKVKPNEILVKVKTVGICGTDLKIYDGSISYIQEGQLELPHTPGHEWVGTVEETGTLVTEFNVDDKVTGECHIGCGMCDACSNGRQNICAKRLRYGILQDGSMTEYIVIPEKAAHKIPKHITDEEACLVEPLTVALYALDKLKEVAGSTILITGLGPIGALVSEIARLMGASFIIGADINPYALQMGKRLGCDEVIDTSKSDLQTEVNLLTKNIGPDIIIEATGVETLMPEILNMIKASGQISLIGLYQEDVKINANLIISKDIKIDGNMASARVWERAINLISSGKIDVSKIITHQYSIDEVGAAFETAYNKAGKVSKVIINMDE